MMRKEWKWSLKIITASRCPAVRNNNAVRRSCNFMARRLHPQLQPDLFVILRSRIYPGLFPRGKCYLNSFVVAGFILVGVKKFIDGDLKHHSFNLILWVARGNSYSLSILLAPG